MDWSKMEPWVGGFPGIRFCESCRGFGAEGQRLQPPLGSSPLLSKGAGGDGAAGGLQRRGHAGLEADHDPGP